MEEILEIPVSEKSHHMHLIHVFSSIQVLFTALGGWKRDTKEATLGVHTNGNVAVDNLIANTNFGTHMSNYKGKREDNYISTSASINSNK